MDLAEDIRTYIAENDMQVRKKMAGTKQHVYLKSTVWGVFGKTVCGRHYYFEEIESDLPVCGLCLNEIKKQMNEREYK